MTTCTGCAVCQIFGAAPGKHPEGESFVDGGFRQWPQYLFRVVPVSDNIQCEQRRSRWTLIATPKTVNVTHLQIVQFARSLDFFAPQQLFVLHDELLLKAQVHSRQLLAFGQRYAGSR